MAHRPYIIGYEVAADFPAHYLSGFTPTHALDPVSNLYGEVFLEPDDPVGISGWWTEVDAPTVWLFDTELDCSIVRTYRMLVPDARSGPEPGWLGSTSLLLSGYHDRDLLMLAQPPLDVSNHSVDDRGIHRGPLFVFPSFPHDQVDWRIGSESDLIAAYWQARSEATR